MPFFKRRRQREPIMGTSSGDMSVRDLERLITPLMAQGDQGNDMELALAMMAKTKCNGCGATVMAKDAWLPNQNQMACPRCKKPWFTYKYGS